MVQTTTDPSATAGDISMREWICWDDDASPTEPTSTLVLTSPRNLFLDIRLLHDSHANPLPNNGGPLSRLDWAFSGASETVSDPGAAVPHKRWCHVIDSHCAWGEQAAADEGDMFPVAGRPEACLEVGAMERRRGEGVVGYREMWVGVEARAVGKETKRQGVVLSMSRPEVKARGVVVRVAQFCQALVMVGGEVEVERWEHCVGKGGEGEWQRVAKLGSRFLPCAWTFGGEEAEGVEEGGTLVDGEMEWKVEEKFEW